MMFCPHKYIPFFLVVFLVLVSTTVLASDSTGGIADGTENKPLEVTSQGKDGKIVPFDPTLRNNVVRRRRSEVNQAVRAYVDQVNKQKLDRRQDAGVSVQSPAQSLNGDIQPFNNDQRKKKRRSSMTHNNNIMARHSEEMKEKRLISEPNDEVLAAKNVPRSIEGEYAEDA